MKTLKILSLLAVSAFSANQLSALTMTFDSTCAGVTQVWVEVQNANNEIVFPQSQNGELIIDFGKTKAHVVKGTSVRALCVDANSKTTCSSHWTLAKDHGVFTCYQ